MARLAGASLLDRIIFTLSEQTDAILINSNSGTHLFSYTGLPVRPDVIADRPGPLAGILTGMLWAREFAGTWVLTVPSDTPFLPSDLVKRLISAHEPNKVVIATHNGRLHPVIGLWPTTLADRLRIDIEGGARRVCTWLDSIAFTTASFSTCDIDPFWNVNTPSDLEFANARVQQH